VNNHQQSIPPLPFPIKSKDDLIEFAIQITIVKVAQALQSNHALTLLGAYNIFTEQVKSLAQMSTLTASPALPSHRWLLSQLSYYLKHHLVYTCVVKKHGIILCRRGKEFNALSYALYEGKKCQQSNSAENDNHTQLYSDLNQRLQQMASNSIELNDELNNFNLNNFIDKIDPVVWDAICHLTKSSKSDQQRGPSFTKKKVRRAYLIAQIMFTIDSRCTAPFHTQITDLVDCCGGSNELIRTLNRLGVCSSYDTLLRYIQECTKAVSEKGILQGMDPSTLTIFSMDNIDFLKSHAQVYCGNQKLSWHGTTIQATQPLENIKDGQTENRKRSRESSSPSHSSQKKKHCGRARTGTELAKETNTTQPPLSDTCTYHFEDASILYLKLSYL
jgi:hypothetical protein